MFWRAVIQSWKFFFLACYFLWKKCLKPQEWFSSYITFCCKVVESKCAYLLVGAASCYLGALSQYKKSPDRYEHSRSAGCWSTNLFPHNDGCFACKSSLPTDLALLHFSPMTQLGVLPTWASLITPGTCSRIQGTPDWLCWLFWRAALSLGEGLMERMKARSWLLLPVLPMSLQGAAGGTWLNSALSPWPGLPGGCLPAPSCLLNKLYSQLAAWQGWVEQHRWMRQQQRSASPALEQRPAVPPEHPLVSCFACPAPHLSSSPCFP